MWQRTAEALKRATTGVGAMEESKQGRLVLILGGDYTGKKLKGWLPVKQGSITLRI